MEENQTETASKKPMNKMLIIGIVVVIIILGGGFLLFGGKSATAPTTTPPTAESTQNTQVVVEPSEVSDSVSIETKSFAFSPTTIKVKAGGKINFTNRDSVSHSFTADDGSSFNSGLVSKDQTKEITAPTEAGTYPFHCTPHPSMKGTLIVE